MPIATSPIIDMICFAYARIKEDEAATQAATAGPWTHDPLKAWFSTPEDMESGRNGEEFVRGPEGECIALTGGASKKQPMADAAYIARYNPSRTLRESRVLRRLVDGWEAVIYDGTVIGQSALDDLKDLIQIWGDHPDYREEWQEEQVSDDVNEETIESAPYMNHPLGEDFGPVPRSFGQS